MRPVNELLTLLADGQSAPVEITEVSVVPLAGAGMLTDTVEHAVPPLGATYVARARGRQLLVDSDEMDALVGGGAAFDQGVAA
jgi:hypothetical protein